MSEDISERLARLVAGYGLERRNGALLDGRRGDPPSESDWTAFRGRILSGHLSGLALAAVTDGAVALAPDQEADLVELHRQRMARLLLLERTLLELSSGLERAGVPVVILKGSSFAHVAYPDPSWRDFDDIDLLVPADRFARAGRVLVELECEPSSVEPRPGFVERFGKAATFRKDLFEIDLHRTLVLGPYSVWVDARRLFAERRTFVLGGRELGCLSPEHRLIHAGMHAILGSHPPSLLPLRDVAELERAGDVDPAALARDARAWRVESVLARAAGELRERLDVEPGPLLCAFEAARPGRAERKALRSYLEVGHTGGKTSSATMRALPGFRPKMAYFRAIAFPDEEFLAVRTGTRGSRWRGYARRWRQLARILIQRRRRGAS